MKPHPHFHHWDTKGKCRDFGTLTRTEAAALLRQFRRDGEPSRISHTPTHRQYQISFPGGSALILSLSLPH